MKDAAVNKKPASAGLLNIVKTYSFVLVFLVIYIVYASVSGGFALGAAMNVFRHSAVIGVIAIGMGIVCLTGDIDLSVGSMLAFVAGFSVVVFNQTNSIPLTLLFAVLFGALCGLINGVLVGIVQMPSFIVTLATMLIYRSLSQYACQHIPAELIGNGSSVFRMSNALDSYQAFYAFGNGKVAGIMPVVGLIMVLMVALFVYICTSTKFGKKIYAVGSNARAAHLAGINVSAMRTLVFVIAGALVGLGAFLWIAMNASADPATTGKKIYAVGSNARAAHLAGINVSAMRTLVFVIAGALVGLGAFLWIAMNASADPATTGKSYEMYAIAAVVLGGIAMSGGKGRILGVLFGAMSYTVIDKIIIALKMDSLINDTIKGVILIVVILIQVAGPQLKARFGKSKVVK